jgi:hypothetical protein
MPQYKHRAFKKSLINADILKASFYFIYPRHKHIAVEVNGQAINFCRCTVHLDIVKDLHSTTDALIINLRKL